MRLSAIAAAMRRQDFQIETLTHRDSMDALGSVLAYVSGRWYETEHGVNGAGDWYKRAMYFLEDLYAQTAREGSQP